MGLRNTGGHENTNLVLARRIEEKAVKMGSKFRNSAILILKAESILLALILLKLLLDHPELVSC